MSQIPSDPGTDNSRRRFVDYDELIAVFVAFLTLGSVLFWGLTRSGVNLFGNAGLFNADSAPALLNESDSISLLDNDDNLIGNVETERDGIGFGAADAIGAAGTGNILGEDRGSAQKSAELPPAVNPAPVQIPATSSLPATPEPPKQEAQPAAQPDVAAVPNTNLSTDADSDAAVNQAPLESTREAIQFQDVPDNYWAKPYIDALSERLVISGITDNTFEPEQPVTRAQLASAIAEAFPLDDKEAAIAFSDIESEYWATDAIDKAVKGGFMSGFPDESFQPTLPVPRAQLLTALVTGLNAAIPNDAETIVSRYGDAADIPEWAIGKMAAATQSNIVVNHPNLDSLSPNQPATRAEVAAMIYQTLAAQGRIDEIDGEFVVKP